MTRHDFPFRFEAVLFDLHGALIDLVPDLSAALQATLHALGRPAIGEERIRAWCGCGPAALVREALALLDEIPGPADRDAALALFRSQATRVAGGHSAIRPGVGEALQALRSRGVPIAVLSCEDSGFADAVLRSHRLAHYFEIAVHGDTLAEPVPAPLTVRHCLKALRTVPPRALMVAGSAQGVAAARNAGIAAWLIGDDECGALDADRVVGSIGEVVRMVRSPQIGAVERRYA